MSLLFGATRNCMHCWTDSSSPALLSAGIRNAFCLTWSHSSAHSEERAWRCFEAYLTVHAALRADSSGDSVGFVFSADLVSTMSEALRCIAFSSEGLRVLECTHVCENSRDTAAFLMISALGALCFAGWFDQVCNLLMPLLIEASPDTFLRLSSGARRSSSLIAAILSGDVASDICAFPALYSILLRLVTLAVCDLDLRCQLYPLVVSAAATDHVLLGSCVPSRKRPISVCAGDSDAECTGSVEVNEYVIFRDIALMQSVSLGTCCEAGLRLCSMPTDEAEISRWLTGFDVGSHMLGAVSEPLRSTKTFDILLGEGGCTSARYVVDLFSEFLTSAGNKASVNGESVHQSSGTLESDIFRLMEFAGAVQLVSEYASKAGLVVGFSEKIMLEKYLQTIISVQPQSFIRIVKSDDRRDFSQCTKINWFSLALCLLHSKQSGEIDEVSVVGTLAGFSPAISDIANKCMNLLNIYNSGAICDVFLRRGIAVNVVVWKIFSDWFFSWLPLSDILLITAASVSASAVEHDEYAICVVAALMITLAPFCELSYRKFPIEHFLDAKQRLSVDLGGISLRKLNRLVNELRVLYRRTVVLNLSL
jgi:hypothetical protein